MAVARKVLKVFGGILGVVLLAVIASVSYAAVTIDSRIQFPDTAAPDLAATTDSATIARGKYLVYGPAHCASCHSSADPKKPELMTSSPVSGGFEFAMGPLGTRYARNLTPDTETGIGRYTDAQIARVLRTGVLPDGQLSFFMREAAAHLADEDIVAVLSYLRSIPPVKHDVPPGSWGIVGKALITYMFKPLGPLNDPAPQYVAASDEPSLARGEYLANSVAVCTVCHTAINPNTLETIGEKGAGSGPEVSHGKDSDMEFVAPNLTSDPTGITGLWTEEAFLARLREGRRYASSIMPWENFQITSESDLRSIYRYLRTLPPVATDLGPSYRKIGWKLGDPVTP